MTLLREIPRCLAMRLTAASRPGSSRVDRLGFHGRVSPILAARPARGELTLVSPALCQ
jgi:hypothetical protein